MTSASPLAANCSSANSRTVSSIPKRGDAPVWPVGSVVRLWILPEEAIGDQRSDSLEQLSAVADDRLRRFHREATDEDAEPPEQRLLLGGDRS